MKYVGYVACMGRKEMCIVLSGKPEGHGRITVNWVIRKEDNTGQNEFRWLKIQNSGGLL